MIPSRLSTEFLDYVRTGAYMVTLPPPDHARADLPAQPIPSEASMADNLAGMFDKAQARGESAVYENRQRGFDGGLSRVSPGAS
jgi:hypothetical protein